MPPHVLCGLRGPPSWAWQECNRLLRLGRPWGAVTFSRWCVSGDRGGCSARRGLEPKFYWSTQTMVTAGIFPFKENSHGRAGNRSWYLMISSQRLWPLDHGAGIRYYNSEWYHWPSLAQGNPHGVITQNCIQTEIRIAFFTVYTLVHKYQMEFTDIAGIRIFWLLGENSTKIFMVFMVTPCINDIKCFIVQIIHSNV